MSSFSREYQKPINWSQWKYVFWGFDFSLRKGDMLPTLSDGGDIQLKIWLITRIRGVMQSGKE